MAALVLVLWLAFALPACAQGGPPFIGDDPGTPGDGKWEINIAAASERHSNERIDNDPILDLNYGGVIEFNSNTRCLTWWERSSGDPTRSGLGKSLAGVKWRFYDSGAENGLKISTYPQLEFNNPTSSVDRGLVDYSTRFYLPLEVSKKIGPFQVNPEAGYWFASGRGAAWATGIVVLREVNPRLELAGEIYNTANTNGSNRWNSYDAGGRYKLAEHFVLLFMAGRSFRGSPPSEPQLFGYLGMQFLFSVQRKKKDRRSLAPVAVPDPQSR